jgi:hypothetical protein
MIRAMVPSALVAYFVAAKIPKWSLRRRSR